VQRHHLPAPLAAGVVVVVLVLATIVFIWMVVVGIVRKADELIAQLATALSTLNVDESTTTSITDAVKNLEPTVSFGLVQALVTGIDAFTYVIAGVVLGILGIPRFRGGIVYEEKRCHSGGSTTPSSATAR
jgi:predicted PurR-regulated permease PerM